MALCAVLAGADDWVEIAAYAKARENWFKSFLKLEGGIPSHDTFGRVFALLDPKAFGKCYMVWVRAWVDIPDEVMAVDGKTLRRSHDRSNGKSAIHMVNAWAVGHGLVLGQVKTEVKSNEITAIPELLEVLDVKGAVVTIDAMGCQKDIAKQIVDQGADYVFSFKGNQGNLHKDVQLLFEDAKKDGFWRSYQSLPEDVRDLADGNFELLRNNPRHPSLQFKKVGEMLSVRVGQAHRALTVEDGDDFTRVWVGSHDDYERMIKGH